MSGDVSNLKVGDPAATKEPFVCEYQVSSANFFDWTKKKSELTVPLSQGRLGQS